ncbi:hypothetical protein [Ectopseudomonas khazarica]|uniref:hypothetical protein n=1 Tax=Ectopseudomonas khazarica TaxID=2502979 RepID=UPI0037CC2AE8
MTIISTPEAGDGVYMAMVAPQKPSVLGMLRRDPWYLADIEFQAWLAEQWRILREQGLIRDTGESER